MTNPYFSIIFLPILLLLVLASSCRYEIQDSTILEYSTSSDSTLFYYNKGWRQIMDQGYYGKAEISYRKALSFDPEFLIGKSVLARLTTNLEERLKLYDQLENHKQSIIGDERLILDVYIALTNFTNIREQDPKKASSVLEEVLTLAESNLGKIAHKYADEIYLKAEYIEFLRALHGPQVALDSIEALTIDDQKNNPFLLGYKADMQTELGQFEKAMSTADYLYELVKNQRTPKPYVVYANLYFKKGELEKAKSYIDTAYGLDSLNVDAQRLMVTIEEKIDLAVD